MCDPVAALEVLVSELEFAVEMAVPESLKEKLIFDRHIVDEPAQGGRGNCREAALLARVPGLDVATLYALDLGRHSGTFAAGAVAVGRHIPGRDEVDRDGWHFSEVQLAYAM